MLRVYNIVEFSMKALGIGRGVLLSFCDTCPNQCSPKIEGKFYKALSLNANLIVTDFGNVFS